MAAVERRPLEVASRRVVQDAKLAIRDVYDAIVELVTNADDRYQILGTEGLVEIELGRQGKGKPSILRVRDFADRMTTEQMNRKLGRIGGRVSGLEEGKAVRGTNSRGAKDIAALGKVTFESIADDGRAHACRIFPNLEYEADDSRKVTTALRKRLGIAEGTGTVATIEVDPMHRIPKIDTLVPKIATLVRLRDIVWQQNTRLVVTGLKKNTRREVSLHRPAGRKRVSTAFDVPGYPGAKAKLLVFRARKQFKSGRDRFRLGGILVKSRHAIHEATLFDRGLTGRPGREVLPPGGHESVGRSHSGPRRRLVLRVRRGVLSRGVLLRILEEKLGTWLALAISAALFGFLHFGNPDMSLRGLLIGDASGVESSILALTLCVAAAVVLLVAAHRKGHFVRPFWARTTEATNNETMGEETNP